MARLGVLRTTNRGVLLFHCPGCDEPHHVRVVPDGAAPCWGFNGDHERPTFTPSVLVRSGHYVSGPPQAECCFCQREKQGGARSPCGVCHSFVRDGQVQFLQDCTHALAGQTVPLAPFGE